MTVHTGGCPTRRLPRAKSRGRFCREWGCSAGKVMLPRSALAVGVSLVAVLLLVSAKSVGQQRDQERVEFGRNITVEPGQSTGDISCFHCSVYVRGNVNGDIAVFGGRVVVEGTVKSDIAVFWGSARLEEKAQVGGDVAVFGGNVRRAPTAALHGEVVSFGRGWVLLPILIMVAILWLVIALIVWLITRGRRAPAPGQPVRQA